MPRLFLGNLRYDVVSMDIESLFKPYGRLLAVNLKRCFGFVELSEDKNARRAIRELNGMRFMGDKLLVEFAEVQQGLKRPAPAVSEKRFRVMVENLDYDVSWQELKDFMRKVGMVVRADVNGDGQGIVDYAVPRDAHRAVMTLTGETLRGRPLAIREMDPSCDQDWDKYRRFVRSCNHSRYQPTRGYNRRRWSLGTGSYHDRRQDSRRSRSQSSSPKRCPNQDSSNRAGRVWNRGRSRSRSPERRFKRDEDRAWRPNRQRSDSRSPVRSRSDEARGDDRRRRSASRD